MAKDEDLVPDFSDLAPPLVEHPGLANLTPFPPFPRTPELDTKILEELRDGVTLKQLCRSPGMPSPATVRRWARDDPDGFGAALAAARADGIETIVDEMTDIADDGSNDWEERERRNGETFIALNTEAVQRSKIRIEHRKWLASVLSPKYRERSTQDVNLKGIVASVEVTDKERVTRALTLLQGIAKRVDPDEGSDLV